MHELAVTKGIIRDLLEAGKEHNIIPKEIYIEVGNLTTYKENPIEYYFGLLKKDHKILKNAKLKINIVEGNDVIIKSVKGR